MFGCFFWLEKVFDGWLFITPFSEENGIELFPYSCITTAPVLIYSISIVHF